MKTIKSFFLLTIFVLAQSITPDERGFIVKVGDSVPDFELNFIDGSSTKISDYLGSPVMLQFTASWCSVCRQETPHIEKEIWNRFRDKGLSVIGLDRDEPLEVVKQFVEEMKTSYPMALDPGAEIFGLFADKESGVTRNVLIDSDGKIVFLTRLFEKEEFNLLIKQIEQLVKSP
jgi:peroxiredoxin